MQGPLLLVNWRARRVPRGQTGEILQAVFADEGITFEIEKEVVRRGFRQPAKSHGFDDGQDRLADRNFLLAAFDLDAGLFANALETFARTLLWPLFDGDGHGGEVGYGGDIPFLQLIFLLAADAGDEREVIVGAAPGVALAKPAADVAMRAGLRVGAVGRTILGGVNELTFYVAIVGGVIVDAMGFAGEFRSGDNDPHELRDRALSNVQQFGVKRQLKNCSCLGFTREFAVVGFVGKISEGAGRGNFAQDIGAAEKPGGAQGALGDHVGATLHGRAGFVEERGFAAQFREVHNFQTLLREEFQVGGFVREAQFLDYFQVGRGPGRSGALATRHS